MDERPQEIFMDLPAGIATLAYPMHSMYATGSMSLYQTYGRKRFDMHRNFSIGVEETQ